MAPSCLFPVRLIAALIMLGMVHVDRTTAKWTRGDTYRRCPAGKIYSDSANNLETQTHSDLHQCLLDCNRLPTCLSINACPFNGFSCSYFSTASSGDGCAGLANAFLSTCFHLVKMPQENITMEPANEMTTSSSLQCQNNGVYDAMMESCICPVEFAGPFCERYPYDCTEMGHNGATTPGTYLIQPVNSSGFPVMCKFDPVELTTVLQWYDGCPVSLNTMSYSQLLTGTMSSDAIFIGLPNMYNLLQQGVYDLHVRVTLNDSFSYDIDYDFFSMMPSSEKFSITYNTYFSDNGGGNGWPAKPALFYSADNQDSCSLTRGFSGWMSSQCVTEAILFETDTMLWPLDNGTQLEVTFIAFDLERTTPPS